MSFLGMVMIVVGALVAWKVTMFFVRLLMVGVVLVGLWLLAGPMLGAG